MTAPRPPLPKALGAGVAVVLLGLVSWVLYGVAAGRADTAFHPNGAPPQYVRLVAGHTYWVAIPGGVKQVRADGVDPSKLTCTGAAAGSPAGSLGVAAVVGGGSDDTKFVDRVGSFVATHSGRVHVECAGIGAVYVANAADAGFDWSGLWLVLASSALVVGLPLVLSGLRRPARR